MKNTLQLHAIDPYMKECQSTLLSVEGNEILLDQTVFYPEGGGQPSDTGIIVYGEKVINILHAYEKEGLVYHQADPQSIHLNDLKTGETVNCRIDWERRFSHMQRHCGEHILSAAFYDLYGGINRGFHMGEDYMTIDISLEVMDEFKDMNKQMIDAVEWEANRYIWNNLPVTTTRFETREEAESHPMRKPLQLDEDIVLVCVGDINKAAGCVACCGTHPRTTGEVGLIKIYRWENYKGMQRITFDAGPNALNHTRRDGDLVKELSLRYSSDSEKLMENIITRENKAGEIRQELYEIKQAYFNHIKKEIDQGLEESRETQKSLIYSNPILKVDDLLNLAKIIELPKGRLLALVSEKENSLLLLSQGDPDCNKIIKDNAPVWRGKGGGRDNSARAMFPAKEDLNCFLDYLMKAHK